MKRHETTKTHQQQGFTLIELSIVLVIIGLIVGGILVGQDLIKAAQLRAAITQMERYDSAVNTFRSKFGGLPGDLQNGGNFFAAGDFPAGCAAGLVSGDNSFEDCAGTKVHASGEVEAFWHQLYLANVIGDAMTDTAMISADAAAPAALANAFPASKIGRGNYILTYSGGPLPATEPGMAGSNLYRILGLSFGAGASAPVEANELTPLEAFQIDTKKDDGVPNSGTVQATDDTTHFNLNTEVAGNGAAKCLATVSTYNTTTANSVQNTPLCQLIIRTSF